MAKIKRTGTVAEFDLIQKLIKLDARDDRVTKLFHSLGKVTLGYLAQLERRPLLTIIPNKHYFAFYDGKTKSRPVNIGLFQGSELIERFVNAVLDRKVVENLSSDEITQACYTFTISLACTVDIQNPGDKQTPGTYFQYLITHLISRELNCSPSERVKVKIGKEEVPLTMDLILDLGEGKPKYHVAIKNSSRERASEVWAHQRILDSAFQEKKYIGVFVGLSETKLAHKTDVVTEISVPNQWRAYQQFVSQITTIYYLDPPDAYLRLNSKEPAMQVKPFGEFFSEPWLRMNS
jgi:hypothetical protein